MIFYVYDLETYANCFLFSGKFDGYLKVDTFEISDRINERDKLMAHLSYLQNCQATMVGYNSNQFDYPILHQLLTEPYTFDALKAHALATSIIKTQDYGQGHSIKFRDRIIPQIDLVKVNHFDNKMKRTSLKSLQFAMRLESVEDLPFDPNIPLTPPQMDQLKEYNVHDVIATEGFLQKCKPMIAMRKDLVDHGILSGDVLNYSDVKIGTEYLVSKIGRSKCYIKGSNPRQSLRSSVCFNDIILSKIFYRTEPFNQVLDWFKKQTIYPGRDERPKLDVDLGGLKFHFGVGGVHASVENRFFATSETHVVRDVDVGGMYPSIAVANGFAPEHLGKAFVDSYRQLQADRKQYPKGSMMNLVLKLANNGVFGNSNNTYSCFYDPKFTFLITINGQLQLLQLAEYLHLVPGVQLIQANTDGITALVPRDRENFFDLWCNEWESLTGLKLEHATLDRMWIRDVNNYIAIDSKGKLKRKGAYWYPLTDEDYHGSSGSNWNKDFSNLTAQKGAEAVLLHGFTPSEVVRCITDPFDFMLRYKTPGGAKLYVGDREMLKTTRYYVSTNGAPAKKISHPKGEIGTWKRRNGITDETFGKILNEIPPGTWDERIHTKNKSKYAPVTTSVEAGRLIKVCNHIKDFSWQDVDFDYYAKEIEKLIDFGVTHG